MFNSHFWRNDFDMAKRVHIDLEKEFETYITLKKVKKIVANIEQQPELVIETRKLLFDKDPQRTMRSAWILLHISFHYPELVVPQLKYILKFLDQNDQNTGAIRCCIRILTEIEIPEKYCSEVFDKSLKYAMNAGFPHAVRVFAIYVLVKICKQYPELKPEVQLIIDDLSSIPQAPSMIACIKKSRKALQKIG